MKEQIWKLLIIWVTCITQEGNKEEKQSERVDTSDSEDPGASLQMTSRGRCRDTPAQMGAGSRP